MGQTCGDTLKVFIALFAIIHITYASTACDVCLCQPTTAAPFLTSCENENLTAIPDNIVNTTIIFVANGLNITNVTAADFLGLTLLQQVELKNNKISVIDADAFKDLISLESLKISSNMITQLTPASLNGLPNLTHLVINDNKITALPDNLCSKLPALESMSAQDNRIAVIGSNTLKGCHSISHIDLSNNEITSIAEDAFEGLDQLSLLDLTGNKLTAFYSAWFADKSSSLDFKLDNNGSWYCDAQMKTEYEMINKTKYPDLISCSTANGFCPLCANFGDHKLVDLVITEGTVTIPTSSEQEATNPGATVPATTACNNITSTCPGSGFKTRPDILLLVIAVLVMFWYQC